MTELETMLMADASMISRIWGGNEFKPTKVKKSPAIQRTIARWYDIRTSRHEEKPTQDAYARLVTEIDVQFYYASKLINIGKFDDTFNPYPNGSADMFSDIAENGRVLVYTGGNPHPILTPEENWRFRAIHDIFGHFLGRNQFGPIGEENAWRCHSLMFSPMARLAMTTETRCQNSWVNFGPFSDRPIADRPYAEQKALVAPIEFVSLGG